MIIKGKYMSKTKHAVFGLCLGVSACLAPLAQAASWVEISNPAKGGFTVGGHSVTCMAGEVLL